jgi:hypothetical protein
MGIGRDAGKESNSPRCSLRRRKPTSILALPEKGGVLISPVTKLSVCREVTPPEGYVKYDISVKFGGPNVLLILRVDHGIQLLRPIGIDVGEYVVLLECGVAVSHGEKTFTEIVVGFSEVWF